MAHKVGVGFLGGEYLGEVADNECDAVLFPGQGLQQAVAHGACGEEGLAVAQQVVAEAVDEEDRLNAEVVHLAVVAHGPDAAADGA